MKQDTLEGKAKTKNGVKRLCFSIICILLEVIFIITIVTRLNEYAEIINLFTRILSGILVLGLYASNKTSSMKMPWVILILIFPIMGVGLYLLIGLNGGTHKMRERYAEIDSKLLPMLPDSQECLSRIKETIPKAGNIASYIQRNSQYPIYQNTDIVYFDEAVKGLEAQLKDLEKAQKFIFMEYHAIEDAEAWHKIQDVLEERVKAGVEVRVFYDDMGSIGFINTDFVKKMESIGIHCRVFNPFVPGLNLFLNNRDHRKITVIDGKVGFTGGINLADEYINVASRFGYWKDTGIRLEGEAVWSMTVMFLEMWNYINHSSEDYKQFMPQVYQKEPFEGDGFVQPYGDTPLDHETVGENIYLNIINHAERYVYIFTPYLIIDNEMLVSLCNAAKRGVDVRIVTPGIPDKKMIFLLTQSHYEPLLKCGVKIYQYTPGFIHAKSFLCDDKIGTVGSINLDYRSLFLHFECGVFMYKTKALMQLKEDCMDTFAASEEMTLEFCRGQNVFIRIFQGMMRLFAPLL
mgnify:CR=1 FL=1